MLSIDHVEASYIRDIVQELSARDDVVVIGAYKGDTCEFIRQHHPYVKLTAFEPQEWAFQELVRSAVITGFMPYNIALALEDKKDVPLYEYGTDAASLLEMPGARTLGACTTVDAVPFLLRANLSRIAFAVINIEGFEYALIPYLLASNLVPTRILVQCHHREMYRTAYTKMHESLNAHTYTMIDVGAGWELWTRQARDLA